MHQWTRDSYMAHTEFPRKGQKGRTNPFNEACRMRFAEADPWLSKREAAAYRNLSIATLDRQIRRGLFPKGQLLSARRRGWRLSTVSAAPPIA